MKLPDLGRHALEMPRLGLAAFARRILFRGVFLLLALATLALALALLQDEKARSYASYQQNLRRTQAEVMARLRHPSGLLALLNPQASGEGPGLRPLLLPYAALDFDDQNKAQQAVEMAGCSVRYPDGSAICVAIGSNPYAGGFIYLVGSLRAGELIARERGMLDLTAVHRAEVSLTLRGQTLRWVAPFERLSRPGAPVVRGRLTGFVDTGEPTLAVLARPVRDFRGWLWQGPACAEPGGTRPQCPRRAFFSIRLPVDAFRDALFGDGRPVWPPADLDRIEVRMQVRAPGDTETLFDTAAPGGTPPPSLSDLGKTLLPGERLEIRRLGADASRPLVLQGPEDSTERSSPLITRLIRRLPIASAAPAGQSREVLATPAGSYEVLLTADARGIERRLAVVATRMSWYVGAMLGAIALAWLVIELGLIRRITVLTRRAAAVSHNVQKDARGAERIGRLEVSDLRGADELGILAGGLADLLQRVKDDAQREQLRAQQERDMLQAVGHEILSPLQSLMVLHPRPDDPARRYVQRMQHAVRVLYGQASPGEALAAARLELAPLDLDAFLGQVAANARFAGIDTVHYRSLGAPVMVRADEFSLEDVVTHILRNAQRHRRAGTPIELTLQARTTEAELRIHNQGPAIDAARLEAIFEYGIGESGPADDPARRGQGLFVARTYMAKMGGSVRAANEAQGVAFYLVFPRVA